MKKERKPKKPNLKVLGLIPERFETASPERFGCSECGLHKYKQKYARPFVPRNWSKKLLVITTYYERPDTTNGRLLLKFARKAGYGPADVAIIGAVRCRKPEGKKKKARECNMKQLRGCRSYLVQAIDVMRPERILVMGQDAARAVLNEGTTDS